MGIIMVGVWLVIFGLMGLVSTKLPEWVIPASALITGLVVLASGFWKRP